MPCYSLTKVGQLIAPAANNRSYYPSVLDQRSTPNAPGDYWVYHSTDHGVGGIYLTIIWGDPASPTAVKSYTTALADGDFDAISTKPASEPIYTDTVEGSSTETPCVVRLNDGRVMMSYHNASAGTEQSTAFAVDTSGLGLNFTRRSTAPVFPLDSVSATGPGDGHDGYFVWGANPFRDLNFDHVGYSLHGGGDFAYSALWGTNDSNVQVWSRIAVLGFIDSESLGLPAGIRLAWNGINPADLRRNNRDELVGLVRMGTPAFGASPRTSQLYEIVFAEDGQSLLRRPDLVLDQGSSGADDENELSNPQIFEWNGNLRVIYTGTDVDNHNALMVATATFDPDAQVSSPLLHEPSRRSTLVVPASTTTLPGGFVDLSDGSAPDLTVSGGKINIPQDTDDTHKVQRNLDFVPSSYDVIEAWVEGLTVEDSGVFAILITNPDAPIAGDFSQQGIGLLTFASVDRRAQARIFDEDGVSVFSEDSAQTSTKSGVRLTELGVLRPLVGLRWFPKLHRFETLLDNDNPGTRVYNYTAGLVDLDKSYRFAVANKNSATSFSGMTVNLFNATFPATTTGDSDVLQTINATLGAALTAGQTQVTLTRSDGKVWHTGHSGMLLTVQDNEFTSVLAGPASGAGANTAVFNLMSKVPTGPATVASGSAVTIEDRADRHNVAGGSKGWPVPAG